MDFCILNKIRKSLSNGDVRSIAVKKNIAGSFIMKAVSIIISLQVIPLTIDYINPTRYGIWLTLSSIIAWLSYFDLGFAHGFRNRFAEAKARNNLKLARDYVSTTYAILFIIFSVIFIITFVASRFLDWSSLLNIDKSYGNELRVVFGLLSCFFCMNIVASVFTTMLMADQKTAYASFIQTMGQLAAFITIYIMTKTVPGSLKMLTLAFFGIPCFLLITVSAVMFHNGRYKNVAPSFRHVNFHLTGNILGLGSQFFIIMMSMLFIYQFTNIIISRVEGPVAVTQYNIAYKYFNVLNMVMLIIVSPFWSAFTDAYTKKDFEWMRRMKTKLERLWLLCIPVLLLMLFFSSYIYEWWIGNTVHVPFSLSVCMAVYFLCMTGGSVYMYMQNGMGKVRLQLIVYLLFVFIEIPLMSHFCRIYGTEGVLFIPALVFAIQLIIGRIQITKIINGTASGIFLK